ncbi:MAG: TIGR03862 family flavoprotein [Chloroflexota bacterium]
MTSTSKTIAIIGGGPAGLMAAEVLSQTHLRVDVYDSMSSLGRKFLMAGKSGLNLTHAEPFERFVSRYSAREVETWLNDFTPDGLRAWAGELGVETFVGTSGRVFPVGMKASPLLRAWLKRLDQSGVSVHLRHKWMGWDADGSLRFETPEGETLVRADAVILALGGGSWARLGSSGDWVDGLRQAGVQVRELRPANCGFDVDWSEHFRSRFEGQPIKSVILSFGDFHQQGEFIITKEGVEGSLVYAASARLRDEIEAHGRAILFLDLAPGSTQEKLAASLSKPRGSRSMSSHIERTIGLKGVKVGLLHEFIPKEDFTDPAKLAAAIKRLPVPLLRPRPLDEAISSAGGVTFESVDEHLMLKNLPGVFCAGEMLDWEAPTGGYLLTACFASGRVAARGVMEWLAHK